MSKAPMSREEALKWIKRNFKDLVKKGTLDKAMKRYFDTYLRDDAPEIVIEEDPTEIFDGKLL